MKRPQRLELILVILVVAAGALYARAAYIPPFADRHVSLASERYDTEFGSPPKWFSAWAIGDGVVYAVIAADPSGGKLGVEIKEPGYRFARAGYGWAVGLVSLGNSEHIPYALALVGVMAMVATLVLAIRLRTQLGPKAWLLVLNPAIYLGFAGDTAEPLATLLLAISLATGSLWASAALGVTRPTFLVSMTGRWRQLGAGAAGVVALGLYSLWRFGWEQMRAPGDVFDVPGLAYLRHSTPAGWLLLLAAVATVAVGLRRRDLSWVLTGLFVLSFGPQVTVNPINAWRAAGSIPVLWAFGTRYGAPTASATSTSASTSRRDIAIRTTIGAKARAALFPKSQTQLDAINPSSAHPMIDHRSTPDLIAEYTMPAKTEPRANPR